MKGLLGIRSPEKAAEILSVQKILEVEVECIRKFLLLQVRDNHLIYIFLYVLKWCFSTRELATLSL